MIEPTNETENVGLIAEPPKTDGVTTEIEPPKHPLDYSDRVSAYEIDQRGLMLGQDGHVLRDYGYIKRQMRKFPSFSKIPTKHSPNKGTNTILRSELDEYNGLVKEKVAEYKKEVDELHDQLKKFANS